MTQSPIPTKAVKKRLESALANAAARGDDALEAWASELTLGQFKMAQRTQSTAEVERLLASAIYVIDQTIERLPDRRRPLLVAGSIRLSLSLRSVDRTRRLELLAEAEALFHRVLQVQPNDLDALCNLGLLLKSSGSLEPAHCERLRAYQKAEHFYRRVLKLEPDHVATLVNLGVLLSDRGEVETSRSKHLAAYHSAEASYKRVLDLQPYHINALANLGTLHLRRGDLEPQTAERVKFYQEAENCYQIILDREPDHIISLCNLAVLIKTRGDLESNLAERLRAYAAAEIFYKRVLKLQPNDIETLSNLGGLLQTRGGLEPDRIKRLQTYEEAERVCRRVLELEPDHIGTLGNLGVLLRSLGELEPQRPRRIQVYEEAERIYRRILDFQPNHTNTIINLAVLLWNFADIEPDQTERLAAYAEAEALYRRILVLEPHRISALINLGVLLRSRGDLAPDAAGRLTAYREAEDLYHRVLALQPDSPATLLNLAAVEWCCAQLTDGVARRRHLAEAAALSARVLELQPTEVKAMRNFMIARLDTLQLDDDATDWPQRARDATELLERRQVFAAVTRDPHFRTELSAAVWPLGPLGAVCHLRADDPAAAVAHLDANMAMSLAEALATPERWLVELEHTGEHAAGRAFVAARDASSLRRQDRVELLQAPKGDNEEAEAARQAAIAEFGPEIEELEQQFQAAIAAIRAIPGFDDFLRPGGDIGLIKAAARKRPLVYLAASPWGGHALVVYGEAIDDVPLPNLTDDAVAERLEAWRDAYLGMLVASNVHRLRRDTRFPPVTCNQAAAPPTRDHAATAFAQATRELCHWLGEVVMQPVLTALERHGAKRAVLLPAGQLSYLPLHAAIVGGSDQRPELALERLQLGYAANARLALASATSLAVPPARPPKVAALLDPAYGQGGPTRLAGCSAEQAVLEAHQVAGRIGLACHSGREARVTPPAAAEGSFPVAELAEAAILHLGCHGASNHVDVFNSCLLLAPGGADETEQRVPVATILDTWPVGKLRLVVLSCCEGAMSGRQSFDELVSLQTAFAQGGAAAVVGAMWAVRDDHTANLMRYFYDALLADPALDPAKALAKAQARLLDTTPEAFPTIAGFQVLQG